MKKRNNYETSNKITVDINELQEILSVGRNTALKIGEDANAVIRFGKRKLYSVDRIRAYIEKKLGGNE